MTTNSTAIDLAGVGAHIDALNLAGLGFATKRFLGREPQRITGQFVMWSRQELPALPSLTKDLWRALSPLGISRPANPAAALCDQVMQGREGDADLALRAAGDCAAAGKAQHQRAPLPAGSGAQVDALIAGVKTYWRLMGGVAQKLSEPVIQGDHDRAMRMSARARKGLAEHLQQIAMLAVAISEGAGTQTAVTAAPQPAPDAAGGAPGPNRQPGQVGGGQVPADQRTPTDRTMAQVDRSRPLGDRQMAEQRAAAFARSERVAAPEPVPEPRPVEVLSTTPVKNRTFFPIIFLLVVAGASLYVIFTVLNAPNPLSQ